MKNRVTVLGILVSIVFAAACFRVATFGTHEASALVRADPCPTRLPAGYRMKNGYPVTTADRFNPHDVAEFIETVLRDPTYSRTERACLGKRGAEALLAHSRREGNALLFEYPFNFPYGRLGTLNAPWTSGLAQGAAMTALDHLYRLDGNEQWQQAAHDAFEAFVAPHGVVTPDGWVHEYPTATPSYVLNGHLFAILAARFWGISKSEARATTVYNAGVTATEKLLSLFEVPTSTGVASSYDLTRLNDAAAVRVRGSMVFKEAFVVDEHDLVLSMLDPLTLRSAAGTMPDLPLSVLATPRVYLRLTYTGSGRVEAAERGRWTLVRALPRVAKPTTETVEIPARFQGRPVSVKYHKIHVRLLRQLYDLTGNDNFRRFAARWSRYAR